MALTKNRISEAFLTDFVNTSMLLPSKTKPHVFSIRVRFDQKSFLMKGVIVPPSKLIATNILPSKGGFLLWGFMRGVDRTKSRFL